MLELYRMVTNAHLGLSCHNNNRIHMLGDARSVWSHDFIDAMRLYLIWHSGKYIAACLIFLAAVKIQDRLDGVSFWIFPTLSRGDLENKTIAQVTGKRICSTSKGEMNGVTRTAANFPEQYIYWG